MMAKVHLGCGWVGGGGPGPIVFGHDLSELHQKMLMDFGCDLATLTRAHSGDNKTLDCHLKGTLPHISSSEVWGLLAEPRMSSCSFLGPPTRTLELGP